MANLTVNSIVAAGTAPTFVAAAGGGDEAQCGFGFFLVVKNTDGTSKTVTIATPGTLPTGDDYPDKQYTVAATTGERWIPLFDIYRDPVTGRAMITYSAVTGVTVALVRMG